MISKALKATSFYHTARYVLQKEGAEVLLKVGGGVSVDGKSKTTSELQSLATLANGSGATLVVRNAGTKTTSELQSIAKLAPGKVIFEL